jgi:hypothetical protein
MRERNEEVRGSRFDCKNKALTNAKNRSCGCDLLMSVPWGCCAASAVAIVLCMWNRRTKNGCRCNGKVAISLVQVALSATLINECMWQQLKVNQSFDNWG